MPMSDKEQIQLIKNWWKEYGNSVLIALLVFAAVNFSWHYWKQYKYTQMERSSLTYTQLLSVVEQQKLDDIQLFSNKLINDYPRSPYASLAAFILAKEFVQKGDFKQALEKMQWVMAHTHKKSFSQLARIRAARLLVELKRPKESLELLAKVDDAAFGAAIEEAKGDAMIASGDNQGAEQAYQKALVLATGEAKSPLLKMKIEQF